MTDAPRNAPKVDQYRELFERSADAHFTISGDTFIDCNDATLKMFGISDKSQVRQTHPSALSPEFQSDGRRSYEKANEMMETAFREGSHRFEWEHQRANGEVFPVEVLLTAVSEGDELLLHTTLRDITDRKKLEAELQHAQKMEGIGQLAGAVAHDFNNMLVAIIGYSELLTAELEHEPELRLQAAEIHRAAERATELTSQLLACSRKQVLNTEVIELNGVLRGWRRMIEVIAGAQTSVEMALSTDLLPVRVDAGQIEMVVLNITTNSRDAMPEGGTLLVRSEKIVIENDDEFPVSRGEYALLSISDDGTGMSAEDVNRAWDPFFTTKERGRGTGLGLASVHGIVTQSGGGVRIRSDEGLGSTVEVFLPIVESEPDSATSSVKPVQPQTARKAKILLAEDDATVSTLVTRVLKREGFEVWAAPEGATALELAREHEFQFDLLLTDVIMPVMNGPELARQVKDAKPSLPILFMTGYADTALAEQGFDADEVDLIRKPFAVSDLIQRVKALLVP